MRYSYVHGDIKIQHVCKVINTKAAIHMYSYILVLVIIEAALDHENLQLFTYFSMFAHGCTHNGSHKGTVNSIDNIITATACITKSKHNTHNNKSHDLHYICITTLYEYSH